MRRKLGDGDQFAGGRQRVVELADQVGEVGIELPVFAEVLGMDQSQIFRDEAVPVDLVARRVFAVQSQDSG